MPESHSYRSILVSHFVPEPEFFKAEIDGKFFFERKMKTYLSGCDEGPEGDGGHGLSTGGHGPAVEHVPPRLSATMTGHTLKLPATFNFLVGFLVWLFGLFLQPSPTTLDTCLFVCLFGGSFVVGLGTLVFNMNPRQTNPTTNEPLLINPKHFSL